MSIATLEAPRLLTIGEVARLVGRSASTVRNLEGRGVVRPTRLEGQDRRVYTMSDVQKIRAVIQGEIAPAR